MLRVGIVDQKIDLILYKIILFLHLRLIRLRGLGRLRWTLEPVKVRFDMRPHIFQINMDFLAVVGCLQYLDILIHQRHYKPFLDLFERLLHFLFDIPQLAEHRTHLLLQSRLCIFEGLELFAGDFALLNHRFHFFEVCRFFSNEGHDIGPHDISDLYLDKFEAPLLHFPVVWPHPPPFAGVSCAFFPRTGALGCGLFFFFQIGSMRVWRNPHA